MQLIENENTCHKVIFFLFFLAVKVNSDIIWMIKGISITFALVMIKRRERIRSLLLLISFLFSDIDR